MTVDLFAGEKVLYTKDYGKGRSRTRGTVIVTDWRVINAVESKNVVERNEIKLDSISGVKTVFRPIDIANVICCFISLLLFGVISWVSYTRPYIGSFSGAQDVLYQDVSYSYYVYIILGIISLIDIGAFVISLLRLRNKLNVIIYSKSKCINLVSASSVTGRVKPLKLKPDKNSAKEIADSISATIKNATA